MQRQQVTSSNLAAVGYDATQQMLEVEFLSGSVYQYRGVPAGVYQGLMAAGSHGTYFHAVVRDRYTYIRVR